MGHVTIYVHGGPPVTASLPVCVGIRHHVTIGELNIVKQAGNTWNLPTVLSFRYTRYKILDSPTALLSGLISPIANTPPVLRWLTCPDRLRAHARGFPHHPVRIGKAQVRGRNAAPKYALARLQEVI